MSFTGTSERQSVQLLSSLRFLPLSISTFSTRQATKGGNPRPHRWFKVVHESRALFSQRLPIPAKDSPFTLFSISIFNWKGFAQEFSPGSACTVATIGLILIGGAIDIEVKRIPCFVTCACTCGPGWQCQSWHRLRDREIWNNEYAKSESEQNSTPFIATTPRLSLLTPDAWSDLSCPSMVQKNAGMMS